MGAEATEEARPRGFFERHESLSRYLLRRARRRRERFLRRAGVFSLRKEAARSLYLTGCILLDALVVPEPIFLLPSPLGWTVSAVAFVVAIWAEYRFYQVHFSLPEPAEEPPRGD